MYANVVGEEERFGVLKKALLALVAAVFGVVAALGFAEPASAATFSNNNGITINDGSVDDNFICASGSQATAPGLASPYPSGIAVSGLGSSITDVNVTVSGLEHDYSDDIGLLLVSPAGGSTLLMADSGGSWRTYGDANMTFDDAATGPIGDYGALGTGTFQPSRGTAPETGGGCSAPASFPEPAPASPYGSSLSVFNGSDPNGTWKLFVIDDTFGEVGSITGWSLDISAYTPDTTPPGTKINQAAGQDDPTSSSPVHFKVEFSERVSGFTSGDVTLGGTAGATTAVVTEIAPKDGTTYDVAVSGFITSDGTVIASIPANKATDAAGNGNDRLTGGAGSDSFDGGPGTDTATDYSATEGDARTNIP